MYVNLPIAPIITCRQRVTPHFLHCVSFRYAALLTGWDYPMHLGVTEAGEGEDGRMKSAIGIGSLLADGLGLYHFFRHSCHKDRPATQINW